MTRGYVPVGQHKNTAMHWCPRPVEDSPYTACGRHIDGPCDMHEAEQQPCRFGLAFTRSTDLESYQHRPYETWPPPCPSCAPDAAVEAARLAGIQNGPGAMTSPQDLER